MKNEQTFKFYGQGQDLLILALKNVLLSIVTLGIYSFWGRAEQQKYMYQNLTFQGKNFDYTGTGQEKLIGFLIAMLGLAAIGVVAYVLMSMFGLLAIFALYLFILAMIPLIVYRSHQYNMSRTRLNNMPFALTGSSQEFAVLNYKMFFITLITLGLATPWWVVAKHQYIISNIRYGQVKFEFTGTGGDFFVCGILGYLLSIVTLGIYIPWWIENMNEFYVNNTVVNGEPLTYEKNGLDYLIVLLKSALLVVVTFGIAIPWTIIWNMEHFYSRINYRHRINFDEQYNTHSTDVSAVGDEAVGALFG
jgi:uncharacterized membrane protein YjgN (DUF898 family)